MACKVFQSFFNPIKPSSYFEILKLVKILTLNNYILSLIDVER